MPLIANVVIWRAGEAEGQRRSVAVGGGDGVGQGQRAASWTGFPAASRPTLALSCQLPGLRWRIVPLAVLTSRVLLPVL